MTASIFVGQSYKSEKEKKGIKKLLRKVFEDYPEMLNEESLGQVVKEARCEKFKKN